MNHDGPLDFGAPYVSLCLDKAIVEMIPWSFPFFAPAGFQSYVERVDCVGLSKEV